MNCIEHEHKSHGFVISPAEHEGRSAYYIACMKCGVDFFIDAFEYNLMEWPGVWAHGKLAQLKREHNASVHCPARDSDDSGPADGPHRP